MKFEIEKMIVLRVVFLDGFFHRIDHAADFLQLCRADLFGEFATDQFIHGGAKIKNLDRFVDRDVAHKYAAVFGNAHQTRFFKHAECFAQGSARNAEFGGECEFSQLFARG